MQGPIGQARRDKTHHPFYIVAAAAIDFALNSFMRQLINLARPARLSRRPACAHLPRKGATASLHEIAEGRARLRIDTRAELDDLMLDLKLVYRS